MAQLAWQKRQKVRLVTVAMGQLPRAKAAAKTMRAALARSD
jgi:hypothetical protein